MADNQPQSHDSRKRISNCCAHHANVAAAAARGASRQGIAIRKTAGTDEQLPVPEALYHDRRNQPPVQVPPHRYRQLGPTDQSLLAIRLPIILPPRLKKE